MFVIYILLGIVNIQFGDCKYPVFYGRLPFWGSAQLHQKISNIFGNYAQIHQQISNIFGTYAQIHQQICKYLFGECQLPNYTNRNYICMCFFGRLPFWGSAQLHQKIIKKITKLPHIGFTLQSTKLPHIGFTLSHLVGSPRVVQPCSTCSSSSAQCPIGCVLLCTPNHT